MKHLFLFLALCGGSSCALSIKHDMGTTNLPRVPQRIVVSSEEMAEVLAALDIKPVGYASSRISGQLGKPTPDLTTPAAASLKGVPFVGTFTQPSQEQIAALKPDLILLTVMDGMNGLYNDMSRLAPTVAFNPDITPWRKSLLAVGQLLGRNDKAQAFLKRYDERIRELQASLPASVKQHPRTALIYMYQPDKAMLMGRKSGLAKQLAQIKLQLVTPPGISPDINYQEISPEILTHLDTDRILLIRKTLGGQPVPNAALDALIKRMGKPVIEYALDPQEADGGPLSDLKRLSALAPKLK